MNKSVKTIKSPSDYRVKNAIVSYYLVLMFSVFPLFFSNRYTSIRHDKLNVFYILSIVLILAQVGILIYNAIEKQNDGAKWYKNLSFTDYAFTALVLCYIASTVFSDYVFESITGTQGRNNGLVLLLVYFLVYIIISRLYEFKEYVFVVMACVCCVVYLLCILNHFYIDPLGMFEVYNEPVSMDFTSTIGNKNIMSCFCCITIPVLFMLFLNRDNRSRILYLFAAGLGFASILCADSESGFLGLVPTLFLVLIYYIRDIKKSGDFFLAISFMLICGKVLSIFSLTKNKGFGSMQELFIDSKVSYLLIGLAMIFAVVLHLIHGKKPDFKLPKAVPVVGISIFGAGIVTIIGMVVYFSAFDTSTKLGEFTSYLRINESWGTHRGFMWINSMEIIKSSGVKNLIFGCGPDTFYSAFAPYFGELEKFGDTSTNCAHNELLNYLVTIGIAGLTAYLALVVSVIVRAIKAAKDNPFAIVFASAIVCYLFQSIVNIAQPITTPLLFIFIAMAESRIRKTQ